MPDSEDNFEVFNRPQSPEAPANDFSYLPSTQVSQTQGDSSIPEAIGLQRRTKSSFWDLIESSVGGNALEEATQAKLLPPPSTQPLRLDPTDHKRKRDQKDPKVVEGGKSPLSKEVEPQKGAKQARVRQTLVDKRSDSQVGVLAWTPTITLDEAPFLVDTSIKDFQQRRGRYVADAVEQALLLLGDMADLRSMRKHKVFLSLKRDLTLVSSLTAPFPHPFSTFFNTYICFP